MAPPTSLTLPLCKTVLRRAVVRPSAAIGILRRCPGSKRPSNILPSIQTRSNTTPSFPPAHHQPRLDNTSRYNEGVNRGPVTTCAFAFDIDGVLLKSSTPIPGAHEALRYLNHHRIPFILLTNGGGKTEAARVKELSEKLDVPLTEENFVQSHTPFKLLAVDGVKSYKDRTILVLGGKGCREVAEGYGFKNVVTPADILAAYPDIYPFASAEELNLDVRPLPAHLASRLKIDAIFVYHDSRHWALETQIVLDLLTSEQGVLGTYSKKNGDASLPNNGWSQDGQPPIFFSNNDLVWSTTYPLSRLGQGGFQACLDGVWNRYTSGATLLGKQVIGKPFRLTYNYAEKVLVEHRNALLTAPPPLSPRGGGLGNTTASLRTPHTLATIDELKTVYMVGDNPESDILGANDFKSPNGVQWKSILVKTGVYTGENGTELKKGRKPVVVRDDVLAAVRWGIEKEGMWGAMSERYLKIWPPGTGPYGNGP